LSVATKYGTKRLDVSVASVKLCVWQTFTQFAATTVESILFLLSVPSLYAFYYVFI